MKASTVGGYDERMESDFTDMKNFGGRESGLERIVRDIPEPVSASTT